LGREQWNPGGGGISVAPVAGVISQFPNLAIGTADDGALIAWVSTHGSGGVELRTQKFNSAGVPAGPADGIQITPTITPATQMSPSLAMCRLSGGDVVLVFTGVNSQQVFAQRFNSSGNPVWVDSNHQPVNTLVTGVFNKNQYNPSVAALSNDA